MTLITARKSLLNYKDEWVSTINACLSPLIQGAQRLIWNPDLITFIKCHHPWRRSPGHLVSYWLYWIHFILENQWFLLPGIDTFQVWVCHSCLWGVSQHRYLGACGVFVGLVDWHRIQSNVMSNPLYSRRGALMGWRPWHSYFPKLTITWVLGLHSWSTNMEMVFYEHRVLSSRTQYTV